MACKGVWFAVVRLLTREAGGHGAGARQWRIECSNEVFTGGGMSRFRVILAASGLFWCSVALATAPSPSREGDEIQALQYRKALAKVERHVTRGSGITASLFRSFNWVGRTAAINYACSALKDDSCRAVLGLGVSDRALLVRDHALKVILNSEKFLQEEKADFARQAVADVRNYRTGQPLWIVERARKYLEGFKG